MPSRLRNGSVFYEKYSRVATGEERNICVWRTGVCIAVLHKLFFIFPGFLGEKRGQIRKSAADFPRTCEACESWHTRGDFDQVISRSSVEVAFGQNFDPILSSSSSPLKKVLCHRLLSLRALFSPNSLVRSTAASLSLFFPTCLYLF